VRPESPEELDMVDWRGRWIDDEEYDEEEDIDEDDRLMEDFDAVGIYILRTETCSLMQSVCLL
jgi:hypothetical protein